MGRGQAAVVGDKNVSVNGYHYIRTTTGWRLEHHVIAEATLGRPIDTTTERVYFIDRDRHNLDPGNIAVGPKRLSSNAKKRARLVARIEELTSELEELDAEDNS